MVRVGPSVFPAHLSEAGESVHELACPCDQVVPFVQCGFSVPSVGQGRFMARFAKHLAVGQRIAAARQFRLDVVELSGGPAQHDVAFLAATIRATECSFLHVVRKPVCHFAAPICSRAPCGHKANRTQALVRMLSSDADGLEWYVRRGWKDAPAPPGVLQSTVRGAPGGHPGRQPL
jgi:hypothetical protein